jgi:hypothetical protein
VAGGKASGGGGENVGVGTGKAGGGSDATLTRGVETGIETRREGREREREIRGIIVNERNRSENIHGIQV